MEYRDADFLLITQIIFNLKIFSKKMLEIYFRKNIKWESLGLMQLETIKLALEVFSSWIKMDLQKVKIIAWEKIKKVILNCGINKVWSIEMLIFC